MKKFLEVVNKFKHSIVRSLSVLLLGIALVWAFSLGPDTPRTSAAGTINGIVYIDYNQNHVRDVSGVAPNYSIDTGVAGVLVTAYDSGGVSRGTATTASDGTYSLNATGTGPYRIEFTSFPTGYRALASTTGSSSDVQYVPDGNSNNIDLGITNQNTYCQNDPSLITNCYINGNETNGEVLIDFPYSAGSDFSATTMGPYQNPTTHSVVIDQSAMGPTFGLAYSRQNQRIYAASFFKKHTNFGPGGPGAIYEVDPSTNTVTGTITVPGATTNSHGTTNVCTGTHTVADCDNGDTGWDAVGKTSLGGLAISEDESLLWVMNLENRTLYEINRSTGAAVRWQSVPGVPNVTGSVSNLSGAGNLPPGAAAVGDVRPFAVEYYNGNLYIGVVSSAESTSGTLANLQAHVYEVNPSTFAFNLRLSVPLNYPRGDILRFGTTNMPAEWNAWTTGWATVGAVNTGLSSLETGYPQPILAGLAFDPDENLILGIRDRAGDQLGVAAPSDPNDGSALYLGESAGDTLLACGSVSTGWTIENNARCGGNGTGPQSNGTGIGGGEYFHFENWNDGTFFHDEITLAGMALIPGRPEMATTVFDPVNLGAGAFSAGARWVDLDEGDAERAYNVFTTNLGSAETFAKANGLGDLIAMCDNAKLQVGNRVWNDANENGIQDPGEAVFANVEIELWADTNDDGVVDQRLGTATTDANGNYVFGGASDSNLDSFGCGTTTGTVDVRVNQSSDDAEENASGGAVITNSVDIDLFSNTGNAPNYSFVGIRFNNVDIPAGATVTNAYIEFVANDATVSGGNPAITIQGEDAGNPGTYTTATNNLSTRSRTTASVAWNPPAWTNSSIQQTPDLTSIVNEITARGDWSTGNSMSFLLSGAVSTAYREAESFDGNSSEAPRLVVEYSIPQTCTYQVEPNTTHEVRVLNSNFNSGQPLENFMPTTTDADGSANGDARDSDGYVGDSDNVVVSFDSGNYGENDLSFDFGFRPFGAGLPIFSIGNRLWFDTNNDGIIDPSETGISGASVSLFLDADGNGVPDSPGSPISTINTDANGYYRFDSLTANNYVVRVDPVNFQSGGVLQGYQNTTGNNTADLDSSGAGSNAENGIDPASVSDAQTNGILSNSVQLSFFAEPAGEPDVPTSGAFRGQGTFDRFADMTVDFGFYGLSLSGTVWNDRGAGADEDDGELDSGETRVPGVTVRLYDSAGNEIPVGPDGILGTADDAPGGVVTDASGDYLFECLPEGDYRVVVDPNGLSSSTPTELNPNANGDQNDNGMPDTTGLFPGQLISGIVTLTPGSTGAAGNNSVNNLIGTTTDPTLDFGLLFALTAVSMDKYEAVYSKGNVVVNWTTGSESNNLGFNVYRSNGGGMSLLNDAPLMGTAFRGQKGLRLTGGKYQWVDSKPDGGTSYYIEDIDLDGTRTMHGPITPSFKILGDVDVNSSALISDVAQSNDAKDTFELAEVEALEPNREKQFEISGSKGVKIKTRGSDLQTISFAQLRNAGFDTSLGSHSWRLYVDGNEVPFEIRKSNGEDAISFVARRFASNFTDQEIYYLVEEGVGGKRIAQADESGTDNQELSPSFRTTVAKRDRVLYVTSILNGDKENWFGAPITTSAPSNQTIMLDEPDWEDTRDAKLTVRLQGLTDVAHAVSLGFNGQDLGVVSYDGKENREFSFDIPMGLVATGENTVTLRSVGGGPDISLVDEIRVEYSRYFWAKDGKLRFRVPAGESVRVAGFESENLALYELGADGHSQKRINVKPIAVDDTNGFVLGSNGLDREFVAFDDSFQPSDNPGVESIRPSDLNSPDNVADLVIVSGNAFFKPAAAIADLREQENDLRTSVVFVDDIYDEFGFGKKSDEALRSFFEHASSEWKTAPRYVLILGDSSYDMRNYQGGVDHDVIPTRLVDTRTHEASSDAWLVDFDEDGVEDVAIGRLPAVTDQDARLFLDKLERYEKQLRAPSSSSNVFVSDQGFENFNISLENLLPEGVDATQLHRSQLTDSELNSDLLEAINASPSVVTFTGHGATNMIASTAVFDVEDVRGLTNDRLGFFMLMTCLTGYNNNTTIDSISEELIRSENGAAAVWSSSGSTYSADQISMSREMTSRIFNSTERIGDSARAAKLTTDDLDARLTWQLIGDPTIIVR